MMSRIRKFVARVVLPAAFGLAVLGGGALAGDHDSTPKSDVSMTMKLMDIYWN